MESLPQLSLPLLLLFALVLGLKHSLEADHLLAVGALVTGAEHRGARHAAKLGAWWGLGHTATLLLAGAVVIWLQLWLRSEVPAWFEVWTQRAVAVMLLVLGARALWQGVQALRAWRRGEGHVCAHVHASPLGAVEHAHFHAHGQHACAQNVVVDEASALVHSHSHSHGSFWVGMVHGLAGSAGLMLLVLAAIPHPAWALLFVGAFGLGSIGAMSAVTALASWSLRASERLSVWVPRVAQGLAGAASLGFGLNLLRGSF